jgi:threonyl-tRNA synthetase
MTGLILHCKSFHYHDRCNSTKPAEIVNAVASRALIAQTYRNAVVILTCIESGDTESDIAAAAEHADHMIREWHRAAATVVVLPFAHLSRDIAKPSTSIPSLDIFLGHLRMRGHITSLATFGSHKEWMVDVLGYPRATSWFEFRDRRSSLR